MKMLRLQINELKVQSFITTMTVNKKKTIVGGIYLEDTDDLPTEYLCPSVNCPLATDGGSCTDPIHCNNSTAGTNVSDPNGDEILL